MPQKKTHPLFALVAVVGEDSVVVEAIREENGQQSQHAPDDAEHVMLVGTQATVDELTAPLQAELFQVQSVEYVNGSFVWKPTDDASELKNGMGRALRRKPHKN
jgi:hypothetical protein